MAEQPNILLRLEKIGDGQSKGFTFERGGEVTEGLVVRKGDGVHAYINSCPHTGVPLDWMPDQFLDIKGEFVQCSMHGALFEISSGLCVHGPCVNRRLEALPVEVVDGVIVLTHGDSPNES